MLLWTLWCSEPAVVLIISSRFCSCVAVHLIKAHALLILSTSFTVIQPTFQSVGDESICLFTFCHSSTGTSISLSVGACDWTRHPSSFWVQGSIGRSQEAGRVWICCPWVVHGAVSSEAVSVWLAWGSIPSSLFSCLCSHFVTETPRAGTAVGWRQQLPLCQRGTEKL